MAATGLVCMVDRPPDPRLAACREQSIAGPIALCNIRQGLTSRARPTAYQTGVSAW